MYKKTDPLFLLIKSMSQTEKRYFKLAASVQRGDRNYLKLFEALEKQEEYDAGKIKKQFHGERFTARIDTTKNYLYRLILVSLESYHSGKSADQELKSLLNQVRILFGKELYDQCARLLRKARKTAEKYGKHLVLMEITEWEIDLIRVQGYQGKTEKEMDKYYDGISAANSRYLGEKEYEHLSTKMFVKRAREGNTRRSADMKAYREIIHHPALKAARLSTYEACHHYYTILCGYYFIKNDFKKAYKYASEVVALTEAHPHQATERPETYVVTLNNLLLCQYNMKMYREMRETLKKFKKINYGPQLVKSKIFYIVHEAEMHICTDTGEFEKGKKFLGSAIEELGKNRLPKAFRMSLCLSMFKIYFGTGEFKKALHYLNEMINEPETDTRIDIHCFVRIINLIVHFEMGNNDLLEHIVKSTYRYLYKRNRLYRFETSIMNFIRIKIPGIINEASLILAFRDLKAELENITEDPFEKRALGYFDFISWLESKIKNKTFEEVVRERSL